jgi:hypothetical protein
VIDLGSDFKTWEDTAGAIKNLDIVISTCTSIAHLSAAMGVETWVLARPLCFYTWTSNDDRSSYWYPSTTRVFREPVLGRWEVPLQKIRAELERRSGVPDPAPELVRSFLRGDTFVDFRKHPKQYTPETIRALLEKEVSRSRKPALLFDYAPGLVLKGEGSPFEIFAFIEKHNYFALKLPDRTSLSPSFEPVDIQKLLNFTRDYRQTDVTWELLLIQPEVWQKLSSR